MEIVEDEPSTDRSLLSRARQGSDQGWRILVQIYGPIVYGWIRRCGRQPADAADVMQETFMAAAAALGRFDDRRDGNSFRGWLWTIARNKLRDQQRRERQPSAIGGSDAQLRLQQIPDSANDPLTRLEQDEPPSTLENDRRAIRLRALECLRQSIDPRSWKMFWEATVQGRDPQIIADEMGVSRWAVYKARARVLQRLREELAGLEEE